MREDYKAAIAMLNEMHQRMGFELVYKLKMERLAVDRIAEKHIAMAYKRGLEDAAKHCDEYADWCGPLGRDDNFIRAVEGASECAAAIRALGEQQ